VLRRRPLLPVHVAVVPAVAGPPDNGSNTRTLRLMVEPRERGEQGYGDWCIHLFEPGLCSCDRCGGHVVDATCISCGCRHGTTSRRASTASGSPGGSRSPSRAGARTPTRSAPRRGGSSSARPGSAGRPRSLATRGGEAQARFRVRHRCGLTAQVLWTCQVTMTRV
jgi:hypothetical protein